MKKLTWDVESEISYSDLIFELLNKSFENITQNFDSVIQYKTVEQIQVEVWIPFRAAWSGGIPMTSAKWYSMMFLIGLRDYVL